MRHFVVLSVLCIVTACAVHPQSHELFPWQLSCGDTPDGFVGVVWNPEPDLVLPLGGDPDELAYYGVCNRTHHRLLVQGLAYGERPMSGPMVDARHPPIADLRAFLSGDDLLFSAVAFFSGAWLHFVDDPLAIEDGTLRRYTVVGHSSDLEGELEFIIGDDSTGLFASDGTFWTDEGSSVPLDHIYNNVTYTRHVSVTP